MNKNLYYNLTDSYNSTALNMNNSQVMLDLKDTNKHTQTSGVKC